MTATTNLRPGQDNNEDHSLSAGSEPSPAATIFVTTPTDRSSLRGPSAIDGQIAPEPHTEPAVDGTSSRSDQDTHDTQVMPVAAGPLSSQPPTMSCAATTQEASDGWLELRMWAEMLDDAQRTRIAAVNRAERGGVDPVIYEAHIDAVTRAEHQSRLALRRCVRRVAPASIIEWQKVSNGIGIDLLARLLGHLGHPVWATPHHWEGTGSSRVLVTDPPFNRTVGQLWQFCGHGASSRRVKGMSAEDLAAQGKPTLKMLLHLNAEACMKCMSSPYRLVYERTRTDVADKVHTVECVRCGPSGKPAQPGTPWSAGHQHAHALRIVGKEILRDLWIVSGGAA